MDEPPATESSSSSSSSSSSFQQLGKRLFSNIERNNNFNREENGPSSKRQRSSSPSDMYSLLRSELDRKDILIRQLLDQLVAANQELEKHKSCHLQALQNQTTLNNSSPISLPPIMEVHPTSPPPLPKTPPKVVEEIVETRMVETPKAPPFLSTTTTSPSPPRTPSGVYLKIVEQPPTHAIYIRILRPWPTVVVVGQLETSANYFVEATLLKKSMATDGNSSLQTVLGKNGGRPIEGDTERTLVGNQAVFRKLKILTTTTQQGAVFVLKFTLKRVIKGRAEVVPNVDPVYSRPIEIFSHTLYLKQRTSPQSKIGDQSKLTTKTRESDSLKGNQSPSSPNATHSPTSSPSNEPHESEEEQEERSPSPQQQPSSSSIPLLA